MQSLDKLKDNFDRATRVAKSAQTKLANAQSAADNANREMREAEAAYRAAMSSEQQRIARQ